MPYHAIKQAVLNRGVPPDRFLDELIAWGKTAADDIFAQNLGKNIYAQTVGILGPWEGTKHRRAAMLEVMRVLAGFESSWNWQEGMDPDTAHPELPETWEAGAWQVSADSMDIAPELKALVVATARADDPTTFQAAMKEMRGHDTYPPELTQSVCCPLSPGAKRSGEACGSAHSLNNPNLSPPLSPCHPQRSGVICSVPCRGY